MISQLFIFFMRCLSVLPLPQLRALGAALGWLLYVFARKRRHVVTTNLKLCFPHMTELERRSTVKQVFVYFAQSWLDRAWLWHGSYDYLQRRLKIKHADDVGNSDAFFAKPLVLFAPHFAGLDAGWTALNCLTTRHFTTIYTAHKNKTLDEWIRRGRSRSNARLLQANTPLLFEQHQGVRPVIKSLQAGEALYLLPDMNYEPRDSYFVPFFGVPAATLPILPRYAKLGGTKTAACQVVSVVSRMTQAGYEIELSNPWRNYPSADLQADTTRMNTELERLITSSPDMLAQYYWVHRRFKDQAEGASSLY